MTIKAFECIIIGLKLSAKKTQMFTSIYLASFLVACMGNLLGISLALYLVQVKQSGPLIIGLAGFAGNFAATITTFLLARYSVKKRELVFFYAPLSIGILYFLVPFSPIPLIFFFLLSGGILYGFFWPSIQKCFAGAGDELRIGVFNLSWSAGVILGSFAAGTIFSFNPGYPFIVSLLLALCAFFAMASQRKTIFSSKNNNANIPAGNMETPSSATVKEIRLLNFLHFFTSSSIYFLYPKLGLTRGFSPQFIGSVAGIMLVSRFAAFFLLMDKPLLLHPARFAISCTAFFISCCLVGLGNTPHIIIIGVVILGAAGAFSYHNSLQIHLKYGLKTEIHEGIIGAGTFAGALAAGLIGQILDLPSAYVIIGVGMLIAGLWHSRRYLSVKLIKTAP